MGRKKRIIFILLLAVLCGMVLSGCGVIEFYSNKRALGRKASNKAVSYISETCGGRAKVVDVEVGVTQVVFRGSLSGDALVTLSMDWEEFQHPHGELLGQQHQKGAPALCGYSI